MAIPSWLSSTGLTGCFGRKAFKSRGRDARLSAAEGRINGDSVIIVGGGIIGLSVAYQLAKQMQTQQETTITVLDVGPVTFGAASSHNTGCLHYDFHDSFGKDITDLGRYSFQLWEAIAHSDARFVADSGYRPQSFFPIMPGDGQGTERLPNWVDTQQDWDVDWGSKGQVCATINPKGAGAWLARACTELGVEIRTSTKAVDVVLSDKARIKALICEPQNKSGSKEKYSLTCNKLVMAAGPWTPSLFKHLFPDSMLDLQPIIDAGDWILMENSNGLTSKTVASVFLDDIVHEKLEYAGRNDETIWVCGQRNHIAELPPAETGQEPDERMISRLMRYSQGFIRRLNSVETEKSDKIQVLETGRAFRPSTVAGLPFISQVPFQRLCPSKHGNDTGVFICYGHGSYGMSLGMGSGKLMAQVIQGTQPDIDIAKFTLS